MDNIDINLVKAELQNLSANKYITSEEARQLVTELQNFSINCQEPTDSENRAVFLDTNKSRVQAIGQRLHEIGGYNLMLAAWQVIPEYDQLELTYAWNGIGIWSS